jgi:hypothetical protein
MSPTFIKGDAGGAAEDMAAVFFHMIRNENGNWNWSLKIGNKSKLVYDWSFSVLGRCDCVVPRVLDLVFFGLVVLCSCFCVDRANGSASGKWICQIDPANRIAELCSCFCVDRANGSASGKWICQIDPANRIAELPKQIRIAKSSRLMDLPNRSGKWGWQINPANRSG